MSTYASMKGGMGLNSWQWAYQRASGRWKASTHGVAFIDNQIYDVQCEQYPRDKTLAQTCLQDREQYTDPK